MNQPKRPRRNVPSQMPLHRQVICEKKPALMGVCDIESIGLGGTFEDACIVLQDKPGQYIHFRTVGKMLEFMAYHAKYDFYFHNGSGYDFSYFIPDLYKIMRHHTANVQMVRQGQNRIIGMQVAFEWNERKYCITIRDSLPLLNMSLEKAAKAFAPEMLKLTGSIDWEKGETYDRHNSRHVDYLHRDCDSLLCVLVHFTALLKETFGISPGWTAGSTAVRAWKAHIPEGHVYYRNKAAIENEVRQAYFGGYVYPGKDRHLRFGVTSIDVNAMFAHAMKHKKGLPIGTPYETDHFEPDFAGVYHVIAHVPHTIGYPCIPSRDTHGFLLWATGDFETTITAEEIVFGQERGCTFEILYGFVYTRMEHPFNEFLDLCEKMELQDGGVLKDLAKLMRNALYGKFGSKLINTTLALTHQVPVDEGYRPVIDEKTGEMIVGLVEKEEENDADYIMPIWAVYITMYARLTLFRLMEAVGVDSIRYCDTDSVKGDTAAIQAMLATGYIRAEPGYGNCKIDEEYRWFQCLGTKNYRGLKHDGSLVDKTKGIPHKALGPLQHFLAAHGREIVVSFDSVNSILARVKNPDLPIAVRRTRTIGGVDKSKSWKVNTDRTVSPVKRKMSEAERQKLLSMR